MIELESWSSFLVEYSSPDHFRTMQLQKKGIAFDNQNYIPLSLDLNSITSPNKYRVLFYATVIYNNNSKIVLNLTNWVDIPPPEFTISTLPRSRSVKTGRTKGHWSSIEVQCWCFYNSSWLYPCRKLFRYKS